MSKPPARRNTSSINKKMNTSKTTPQLRTPEERRASYMEFLNEPTPDNNPTDGLAEAWEHMNTSRGWK